MCLARFPTIHVNERPFLLTKSNPSYLEISGDPQVVAAEPPTDLLPEDWFNVGAGAQIGQIPYQRGTLICVGVNRRTEGSIEDIIISLSEIFPLNISPILRLNPIIYGEDWIDFIKEGARETITFPPTGSATVENQYLGTQYSPAEDIPLWVAAGYNRIWNRYFRSPTDDQELADTDVLEDDHERIAGRRCGWLPTPWSTAVQDGVPDAFREVSTAGDSFDIVDLNRIQAEYRTDAATT